MNSSDTPFLKSLLAETKVWIIGVFIAVLSVFSAEITDSIKSSLNNADLKSKYYEDISFEVSDYIFASEVSFDFIYQGLTHKESLESHLSEYNSSITLLRKKEYVYRAWLKGSWNEKQINSFETFISPLKKYAQFLHSLNLPIQHILNGSDTVIILASDVAKLNSFKTLMSKLKKDGEIFLVSIQNV